MPATNIPAARPEAIAAAVIGRIGPPAPAHKPADLYWVNVADWLATTEQVKCLTLDALKRHGLELALNPVNDMPPWSTRIEVRS